ncbi:MAG: aspartate kinase [Candidatus Latescibacteria bacterium]|nr:aspartate kinase [Candidatus Latescibacterota bacterium]
MIVMKFGGTSVGTVEALQQVARIVAQSRHLQPVVVVSAMSGVTDTLRAIAADASQGNRADVQCRIEDLRARHTSTVSALLSTQEREGMVETVTYLIDELENVCHGITLLQELSPRTIDLVSSFGERLSAPLVSAVLREQGVPSTPYDARLSIKTDDRYTEAEVDFAETNSRLVEGLRPAVDAGTIPVITGFIGSTQHDVTTTLGRGASDYTAAIVGSALKADEIWIWTDVDGAMTADPRIVSEARVLAKISYQEAAEMSYFGAKVLHPKTMLPAVKDRIPIRIKNTFNPSTTGTLISEETVSSPLGVKTVTNIDHVCLVTIEGSGLIGMPDTPARVFKTTAQHQVNLIMFTQASSEHDICLVILDKESDTVVKALLSEFRHELERGSLEAITVQPDIAVVAVVGEGMKGTPGIAARTFGALGAHRINIIAIAQGSSELNISFVVDRKELKETVRLVHSAFELDKSVTSDK